MGICRQVASIDRIPHTSYPPLCPLYRALAIPSGHLRYRHPSIIYIVYPAGQGWTLRPDWSRDRGRVIKYIKKGKKHRFDIFFLSIDLNYKSDCDPFSVVDLGTLTAIPTCKPAPTSSSVGRVLRRCLVLVVPTSDTALLFLPLFWHFSPSLPPKQQQGQGLSEDAGRNLGREGSLKKSIILRTWKPPSLEEVITLVEGCSTQVKADPAPSSVPPSA